MYLIKLIVYPRVVKRGRAEGCLTVGPDNEVTKYKSFTCSAHKNIMNWCVCKTDVNDIYTVTYFANIGLEISSHRPTRRLPASLNIHSLIHCLISKVNIICKEESDCNFQWSQNWIRSSTDSKQVTKVIDLSLQYCKIKFFRRVSLIEFA